MFTMLQPNRSIQHMGIISPLALLCLTLHCRKQRSFRSYTKLLVLWSSVASAWKRPCSLCV